MKVAVTGHTRGIGQAVANLLQENNCDVLGFSRSNGYNITAQQTEIVSAATECDVFINNAYCDLDILAQTNLFKKMFEQWRYLDKTIVNINSRAHYGNASKPYARGKKVLHHEAFMAINHLDRKCKIINISPGYVSTDRVKSITEYNMLSVEEIAYYIKWAIDQPVEIGELSLWRDA